MPFHRVRIAVLATMGALLASCERAYPAPPLKPVTLAQLGLYPASASVGEGKGAADCGGAPCAYTLGVFEVAGVDPARIQDVVAALTVSSNGVPMPLDFAETDGTYGYFGLYVPTVQSAAYSLSVQTRATSGYAASNVLTSAFAVTQDLDPTFGSGGIVIDDDVWGPGGIDEEARAVAVQPDGRIIIGGFAHGASNMGGIALGALVARYLADGTPDASFGNGGRFALSNYSADEVHALALQPDGKILAAGTGGVGYPDDSQAMVIRLLSNGTLDTSFGTGGITFTSFHYRASADGIAIQPDGSIVIAGVVTTGTDVQALVVRFTADGAVDPAFGTSGMYRYSSPGWDKTFGIAVDGGGNLVVAGSTSEDAGALALTDVLVFRLTPGGVLDSSFGTGGVFQWDLFYDTALGVGIQDGGRIVVGGGSWDYAFANDAAFAIGITPAGTLDSTFGDGGAFWSRPFAPYGMGGTCFAMSASGAPVIGGYRGADAVVIKLTTDGLPDTSFSVDGFAAVTSGGIAHASGVALQSDGKIVLAGHSTSHDGYSDEGILLARFAAP